ncbi:MAG: flagellar basal-body MS-ring/collar protein FliF [Gammaproteobacteria bacterium]
MAELVKADTITAPWQGMITLPMARQLGLLVGLAVSIALGVTVALWMKTPTYTVLYSQLTARDAKEVIQVLNTAGVEHTVDTNTGALMVASSKIHTARLALAEQGLPRQAGAGFELLEKEDGFGTSNFLQTARYQHAMEGELARTIVSMASVETARVHLALPKESAFIRDRRKASASVMVKLASGRRLAEEQVAAILHLVASSVPNMEVDEVTIVDHKGRLLTGNTNSKGMALTASQFEHTSRVEEAYVNRVEHILTPVLGNEHFRAQVVADIDFSQTELTQERFNPDLPAMRSEQRVEERMDAAETGGIPGALTNQPPGAGNAPEQAATAPAAQQQGSSKTSLRSTKNFELDRTISHTRRSPTQLRRLSVAVVVDDKLVRDDEGNAQRVPYTPEELTRITNLVQEAVGYNPLRGDSVNVINTAFTPPAVVEPLPVEPLWKQKWVHDIALKVLGGLFGFLLMLFTYRIMRSLASRPVIKAGADSEDELEQLGEKKPSMQQLTYENNLEKTKAMAVQEPKMVAQVVKGWVAGEGH